MSCRHWTAVVLAIVSSAAVTVAAQPPERWYVELGVTRPHVSPVLGDFSLRGSPVDVDAGHLTFPHVAAGRRLRHLDVELGYRKVGVAQFRSSDGTVRGNTHSNAIEFSARVPLVQRGRLRFDAALGGQVIRTIATNTVAPSDWPIAGGVNTWRAKPLLGIGANVRVGGAWAVGVDYAPILGQLGTARSSGRYRQQVIGIDLRRSW